MMALTVLEYHFGSLAQSCKPHAFTAAAHALGQNLMPFEHAVEALLEQHVEILAAHRALAATAYRGNIPSRLLLCGRRNQRTPECSGRSFVPPTPWDWHRQCRDRRKHEPLLRSSDSEIHTPLVHSEIDARDRTDAVNVEHRRVGGSIDRAPYHGDVARNTGGGLVVDYKNTFDCMRPVGPQGILNAIGRGPYPHSSSCITTSRPMR